MNILVIAHYQGDGSPCAIFVHEQLKSYIQEGCNVYVISPVAILKRNLYGKNSCVSESVEVDGIEYFYLRFLSLSKIGEKNFNSWSAIQVLSSNIERIKQWKPSIIHAHTLGIDSDIGFFLKNKLGIPLITTVHGSDLEIPLCKGELNLVKRRIFQSDRVVTISQKLEKKIHKSFPQAYVSTILNGCNVEYYKKNEKIKNSILFVGNLIKQKNVDVVIKTLYLYRKKNKNAILTIIGDGPEKESLKKLCYKFRIDNTVIFTGHLSNSEVIEHMSRSEYFIMPSVNEGFGIVYIEAMACGCVTIGTKGEGIDGFIIDGENGILCCPNEKEIVDRLIQCEEDSKLKERIMWSGIDSAKELTWQRNAKENIAIFNKVLNG